MDCKAIAAMWTAAGKCEADAAENMDLWTPERVAAAAGCRRRAKLAYEVADTCTAAAASGSEADLRKAETATQAAQAVW